MNITPTQYLHALALFTLANQNYVRANKYGEGLSEILGGDADDFILGDAWLEDRPNFDAALKGAGYVIRKRKVRKSKRKK